jgi:hypothetical protein
MNFEKLRKKYRPQEIRVLFIGESPPAGKTFFYAGNSKLAKYTEEAFRKAYRLHAGADFLAVFRSAGCYLDDLCLQPVNRFGGAARQAARTRGVESLSRRLASVSPQAIIPLLMAIVPQVRQAAEAAGLAERVKDPMPFPSMGRQRRYVTQLSCLIAELRKDSILPRTL